MQVPAEPPWLTGRGHSLIPWTTVRTSGTSSVRAERGSPPIKRACRSTAGTDASFDRTEIKHLHHPVVGKLDLTYEAMNLPADPELTLLVYTAEPGSASEDGLKLLASWAAATFAPADDQGG
ncbi:MAG: helix-turn-helix domain protein [Mycobacterium sp.]|nr:helix-turn-helix domain protein [Mycobacterium sp.]